MAASACGTKRRVRVPCARAILGKPSEEPMAAPRPAPRLERSKSRRRIRTLLATKGGDLGTDVRQWLKPDGESFASTVLGVQCRVGLGMQMKEHVPRFG